MVFATTDLGEVIMVDLREAVREDLEQMVHLLSDDPLGSQREDIADAWAQYESAFSAIQQDPNHRLIVVADGSEIVGVLQLSFLPNLTFSGQWRAQIEGVRVKATCRGQGVGAKLLQFAIDQANERGCKMVQLTTNRSRKEALEFYEGLGFQNTHHGLKLMIS